MFVGEQVLLDVSFPVACERFTRFIREGWLNDASDKAHADGLVGLTRVGPFGAVLGASKLVRVHVVEPVTRGDAATAPLRWEATGVMGRLFPILDADLTVRPAEGHGTQLTLAGVYRPPFAGLGSGLDRLVLHRAATATVGSLLQRIAAALTDPRMDRAGEHAADRQADVTPGQPGLFTDPDARS